MTKDDYVLRYRLDARGIHLPLDEIRTLRLAEKTLHRWFELECGDSNNYASWAIERDENGEGPPFLVRYPYDSNQSVRTRIPDREAGARKRIAAVCDRYRLYFYVQTDPRGCALYLSTEPMKDFDYSGGIPCCV